MKQFQIEVLSVTNSFVKNTQGGYNTLEVAYKQDGKVTGKKILDFVTPVSYKTLLNAKAGEVYFIESEKNDKGYIDWITVTPVEVNSAAGPVAAVDAAAQEVRAIAANTKPTPAQAGRGRVVGNTYETPEERFTNRAAIIRQSTINMALQYTSNAPVTLAQLLVVARSLEDHIYTDLQTRAESLRTVVDGLKG